MTEAAHETPSEIPATVQTLRHPQQGVASAVNLNWVDGAICLLLGLCAIFGSLNGARIISSQIVAKEALNTWFDADTPRVYTDMSYRMMRHDRTNAHPLFVIVTWSLVHSLRTAFDLDSLTAVRIVLAQTAGLWVVAFFVLLRILGICRLDSTLFTILAAVSASTMFWFVLPETFVFGSLSILLVLVVAALSQHHSLADVWFIVASAASLGMTLTNWIAGIILAFVYRQYRSAIQVSINAFCLVVALWAVEAQFFPVGDFFLVHRDEQRFMVSSETGGTPAAVRSFVFHSMVMPQFKEDVRFTQAGRIGMITQLSNPGSASLWGAMAVVVWAALLVIGIHSLFNRDKNKKFKIVLGLTTLAQLLLHMFYGWETFLYSAHFGPLLILLVALGSLGRFRPIVLTFTAALILFAGINNLNQFKKAAEFHQRSSVQLFQSSDNESSVAK